MSSAAVTGGHSCSRCQQSWFSWAKLMFVLSILTSIGLIAAGCYGYATGKIANPAVPIIVGIACLIITGLLTWAHRSKQKAAEEKKKARVLATIAHRVLYPNIIIYSRAPSSSSIQGRITINRSELCLENETVGELINCIKKKLIAKGIPESATVTLFSHRDHSRLKDEDNLSSFLPLHHENELQLPARVQCRNPWNYTLS